jgi:hypothetical protein
MSIPTTSSSSPLPSTIDVNLLTTMLTKLYTFDEKIAKTTAEILVHHGINARNLPYKLRNENDIRALGITNSDNVNKMLCFADTMSPTQVLEIRSFLENKVGLSPDDAHIYATDFSDYG